MQVPKNSTNIIQTSRKVVLILLKKRVVAQNQARHTHFHFELKIAVLQEGKSLENMKTKNRKIKNILGHSLLYFLALY